MFHVVFCISLLVFYMQAVGNQLPRLGKRELICLLSLTCKYVVFVWRGILFLLVLGIGCGILFLLYPRPSVISRFLGRLTDQGSPSVMQHIVSVESSSLLLHSYLI